MNKKTILLFLAMMPFMAFAQNDNDPSEGQPFLKRTTLEAGLTIATSGSLSNVSLNGMQYWGFGKKNRKFKIGAGVRLNNYFGSDDLQYITAPADLTGDEATIDSLVLTGTQVSALNLFLALRYDINERWGAEFNIDLAGFSFGGEKDAVLTYDDGESLPNAANPELNASPAEGNILLIGDNDFGNLNSEFLLTYRYKSNWRFKAGAMFNFNEYMTDLVALPYTASNGTIVDGVQRYRTKNMTFGVGVNYIF
jgi:long-subunit fatty acid transport protein